jgi:hypothetical protein
MAVGDQAGGEAEEGFVDVVASFPADPQTPVSPLSSYDMNMALKCTA